MKTFDNFLTELFDSPYRWRWSKRSRAHAKAIFTTKDGDKIHYHAGLLVGEPDAYEISFGIVDEESGREMISATQIGDAFKIFATIVDITRDWYKKQEPKPKKIYFSSDKTQGKEARGRSKIYDRFAKKLAKETGMKFKKEETEFDVSFILTKK